ncbi:MAG: hypothetical protein WAP52_01255 [Candidatus Sungiibacteriota bacterium]
MTLIKKTALILLLGFLAINAHAQAIPPPVSLTASPASPSPRTQYTITASTPTFDKDLADFEWTVDGKKRPEFSGVGANEITLAAGAVGSITKINVGVSRPTGDGGASSLTVIPSELSLPWIAETATPQWYRGKALPTPGAIVSIIAVPRIIIGGSTLSPDSLIYRWRIDSDKESLIGAGKRVFTFTASTLPETTHQIDVSVEDIDGRIHKDARVLITTDASPRVVLYASSPLGGTEPRSAGSASARPGLFDVIAELFFFPLSSLPSLTYNWIVDGNAVPASPQNQSVVTIDAGRRANENISVSAVVRAVNLFQNSFSGLFNLFISQ